ncbi:MAG: ABC transporter substrate-binding protein [Steroidobacteraceae bacterium]
MRLAKFLLAVLLAPGAYSPAANAEVKVGVSDWTGWVAWYVAQDQGFFRRHGADVKLVWFANYSDSISALSTGQLDANSQTWSDTLGPLAKGLPLKVVLVNDNSAGNDALMVGPKVKGFADLRGRTIALEQYSVSHFVLYTALAQNGLTPKDVKIVNLSAGDAAAAFMSGRVDAAVVWNPWISQIQKSGKGRPLFTSAQMPGLIPDLLVVQAKSLQNKRKDLTGMIQAWLTLWPSSAHNRIARSPLCRRWSAWTPRSTRCSCRAHVSLTRRPIGRPLIRGTNTVWSRLRRRSGHFCWQTS